MDKRRKIAHKRAVSELTNQKALFDGLMKSFKHGKDDQIQLLLSLLRAESPFSEVATCIGASLSDPLERASFEKAHSETLARCQFVSGEVVDAYASSESGPRQCLTASEQDHSHYMTTPNASVLQSPSKDLGQNDFLELFPSYQFRKACVPAFPHSPMSRFAMVR